VCWCWLAPAVPLDVPTQHNSDGSSPSADFFMDNLRTVTKGLREDCPDCPHPRVVIVLRAGSLLDKPGSGTVVLLDEPSNWHGGTK